MKTTLELPDDLVQRIKIRAVQERRPLKRLVADLLIKGMEMPPLAGSTDQAALPAAITLNEQGFPLFRCRPNAREGVLTAQEIVALEQEILEEEEMRHAGYPL